MPRTYLLFITYDVHSIDCETTVIFVYANVLTFDVINWHDECALVRVIGQIHTFIGINRI